MAGIDRDQALDLAARACGLAPDALPDPEPLRRAESIRQDLERSLADVEQQLAEARPLPVLFGLAALGTLAVAAGVLFDANAIAPAYSELDHDPRVRLALSGAAVSGAVISTHLALRARTWTARWGFGALTGLLLGGTATIRALYGTPLGLSLLGLPVHTTQGALTILCQGFNAMAATAGSVMLASAGVALLARVGPELAGIARLRRNRSVLAARLEDHAARTRARQALAGAEAARARSALALAELAFLEGRAVREAAKASKA
jgi:hypothetical protein